MTLTLQVANWGRDSPSHKGVSARVRVQTQTASSQNLHTNSKSYCTETRRHCMCWSLPLSKFFLCSPLLLTTSHDGFFQYSLFPVPATKSLHVSFAPTGPLFSLFLSISAHVPLSQKQSSITSLTTDCPFEVPQAPGVSFGEQDHTCLCSHVMNVSLSHWTVGSNMAETGSAFVPLQCFCLCP